MSEREKFRISGTYYLLATGELEKAIQAYELWAQTYPRNSEPFGNLGVDYSYLGQYEKAVAASLEDLRLTRAAQRPSPTSWDCMRPWTSSMKRSRRIRRR